MERQIAINSINQRALQLVLENNQIQYGGLSNSIMYSANL